MAYILQPRGDTAANWTAQNPVLFQREFAFETDTMLYKIGDGVTAWNSLPYRGLAPELGVASFATQPSKPSPPSSGMQLFAQSVGGRIMPRFQGPAGVDVAVQPSFFGNGIHMHLPGSSTSMNVMGGANMTTVGTMSHPTLTAVNMRTSMSRASVLSAATADSVSEVRVAATRIYRGDAPGRGGFFHRTRFAFASNVSTQRVIIGFTSSTSAIATTQVPTALTNWFGVGADHGDANLQFMANGPSGTASKVDLGFDKLNMDAVYDLTMFAAPNGSSVAWEVERLDTGVKVAGVVTDPARLPLSTTFLAYHAFLSNGGTAAAVTLEVARVYTETDY